MRGIMFEGVLRGKPNFTSGLVSYFTRVSHEIIVFQEKVQRIETFEGYDFAVNHLLVL